MEEIKNIAKCSIVVAQEKKQASKSTEGCFNIDQFQNWEFLGLTNLTHMVILRQSQ